MSFHRIDVHELKRRRDDGWAPYVLDVRGPAEAEVSTLSFIDRLEPHTSVLSVAEALPRDRDIVVICRSGGRSAMACNVLASVGFDFDKLYNLEGGINAWATHIDSSLRVY